jgi:hypothetical protein
VSEAADISEGEGEEMLWTSNELQQSQQEDPDIGPIIKLMKNSMEKPSWSKIAPESAVTKAYWAQWETLRLKDGILYRLWVSPTDDHTMQLVLPRSYREQVKHQLHNQWTLCC